MSRLELRDIVHCPLCGSSDVVYSCEPKCCFNHVCSECKATFQLTTHQTGGCDFQSASDANDPESAEPTAACAVCHGMKLGVVSYENGRGILLCSDCRSLLELAYEDIAA
jgi:hypothetical protein